MKKVIKTLWSKFIHGTIFSPAGFLFRAILITIIFFLLEGVGLRHYTMFISGTSPTGNPDDVSAAAFGCVYLFFYVAFVVLAPILLIASMFFYLLSMTAGKPNIQNRKIS